LVVIITGTYDLVLTTPSGRLNAQTVAGRETALTLEVQNHGSADLENISFSSREPSGWSVTFSPEEIDLLAPGETRQVTAHIKPAARAIAGDYLVNLTASTRETSGTAQIRVLVKTSTLWGLVGIVIILAVIAGVGAAFRQYGRR
ncbi:MAG: NEW3 domain-containing protein, partial [bacterium]